MRGARPLPPAGGRAAGNVDDRPREFEHRKVSSGGNMTLPERTELMREWLEVPRTIVESASKAQCRTTRAGAMAKLRCLVGPLRS